MRLEITIESGNAAFDPFAGAEAARIIRAIADRIADLQQGDDDHGPCVDENGNRCGEWSFDGGDEPEEDEGDEE